MRARIAKYRRLDSSDRSDFAIGCRILTQPFFFEEADWIPVPKSWSPNIVSFKTYDTDDAEGRALWDAVAERMARLPAFADALADRFGKPLLVEPTTRTRRIPGSCDGHLQPPLRGHAGANLARTGGGTHPPLWRRGRA